MIPLLSVLLASVGVVASDRSFRDRSATEEVTTAKLEVDVLSGVLLATALGLTFGLYFVLRYGGNWTEWDTMVFSQMLVWFQEAGSLHYNGAYDKGYAYSAWAANLSTLTGVPAGALLRLYLPIIGNLLLALFGYAAFRRWLRSNTLGLVATSLLFLVPELVFTVSRGNHEKLTVSLTLLASLSLLQLLLELTKGRWQVFTSWLIIYYLLTFTLVSLNSLFGSSLVAGSTIAFFFALVVLTLRPAGWRRLGGVAAMLGFVALTSWLIVGLVTQVVYPQAWATDLWQSLSEAVRNIFAPTEALDTGGEAATYINPYEIVAEDWISQSVYGLISSFRWLLLGGSFVTWLVMVVKVIRDIRTVPLSSILLVALYGAFGMMMAAGVMVDFLGLEAGSNLQVRFFAYFAPFAVPLLALGAVWCVRALSRRVPRGLVKGAALTLFATFTVFSLLKATLDPMVSNRWIFYHPTEVQAVHFWDDMQRSSAIWVGPTFRVVNAFRHTYSSFGANQNDISAKDESRATSYMLDSRVSASSAVAWQLVRPTTTLENRVYDNGNAQIYHRVPRSPFQQ